MKNRLPKRLSAWLLTLVMLVGMLPAMASADEVDEDLSPPAPQEENYGYVRLVFSEGEQLDLYHGEYITECSPTAAVHDGADEDFLTDGDYLALYYEGKLYCKATLDGVSIDADAVLPAEAFALVPMGEYPTTLSDEGKDETPPSTEPESKEEDKTTEDEGGSSGSDYNIGDDTQPRGLMRMPVMPTAAGNYPEASSVSVDGGKRFYNNRLYYRKGDPDKNFTGNEDDYIAHYNPDTGTLTLNGYDGGSIKVDGVNRSDITVVLIGTNTIKDGSLENAVGGNITITSNRKGTLSITNTLSGKNPAIGIETGFSGSYQTGNVTIKGNAKVTINMTKSGTTGEEKAYGIFARENITISGDASMDITCATPSNTTGGGNCNGLRAEKNVSIDTTGTIKIDVTDAGKDKNNGYSYGVFPMEKAILTKVGNMEVQWKKEANNSAYSGGAVRRGTSFSDTDHAINVDTTNCYASYRYSTSYYTVRVENGQLTGPGVKYANGSGKFLYDDKVDLTAPPRQVSANDSTLIPFVKWTSADVSVTNPTSQSGAYITVPNKDAKVQAHYKAFTVQPSFTRNGSNQGTVSCTLISTDHSGFPKICRADTLGEVYSSFRSVDDTTTYESEVYKSSNPPGEYVVKVEYNKVTYYSEPFVIDYSARAAVIDPVTISGETGQQIPPADVTVRLQDCTFNNSLGSTGGWITNLPAGLSQSVTLVSDKEAKITVSGKPTANCVEQIKVTVPKAALSDGSSPLTAPSSENAKFDIKTTLTTAAATIQPPVAGQHPDMNPVSADLSKYSVAFDEWSGPDGRMGPTDTFKADKWYDCYLIFTPKPGYAFASGSDMTYTINGETARERSPWVYLSMEALPSAISLDVSGTVDLGNKKLYDPVPVKNIEVTNHLSSEISNIPITLSDPTNFRVLPKSITSIPANGTGTFQVAPAPNLPVGGYSTTVTVGGGSSGIIAQSFTVEFSVREVIMLTAKTLTYNGEWQTGVTASEADVIIEGNRQRDAGDYTATAHLKDGYYMWPDYTTNPSMDISWSIGKRTPQPTDIVVTPPAKLVYDGNRKDATVELDSKYTGAGAITISKYENPDTGEEVQPINAGTYRIYVNVAGGSNFNPDTNLTHYLSSDWNFTIDKASQNAPAGLGASAPTDSGGKGKINRTTANMQYTKTPDVPISWSDCTEGSTEVDPDTYYVRYKGNNNHNASDNVKVIVPAYGAGVTVSGTAVSWNAADDAQYYLYPSTMEDAAIKAEWKSGYYTGTACTSKSTPTASGKQFEQTFTFDTVAEGDYKLVIVKPGHGLWIEELTVNTDNITDKSIRLYKMGDVNRDGKVNGTDALWVRQSSAGGRTLDAYQKVLADLNRDGKVNGTDALWIRQISAGSRTLTY